MNNYSEYVEKQMKDSEFAAHYALSREKIRIELYLEKLKENVESDADKKTIIKNINKIKKYINQIAL